VTLTPEREQEIRDEYTGSVAWPGKEGARDDVVDLLAEVDGLRAAGDKLADAAERYSRWGNTTVRDAVAGWREVRRG
jgi:hypothetical protein